MSGENSNVKTGLVLEGGAMRAIYSAGVLDVLGERGVSFDGVIGVSAGAIHGSSFVSGQHGRNIRFYLAYCRDWRFFSYRSFLLTGNYVSTKFLYERHPDSLLSFDHEAFEASPTRFFVTCTDLETGAAFYREVDSLRKKKMRLLRASASMPMLSKCVKADGLKLLDGGTSDSVPVEFFRAQGFKKSVVVLTQPQGYIKTSENSSIATARYRAYPAYLEAIETRHTRYNEKIRRIEALEKDGKIVVIRPSKRVMIGRVERNPALILEMYELGRSDALEKLAAVQEFLAS